MEGPGGGGGPYATNCDWMEPAALFMHARQRLHLTALSFAFFLIGDPIDIRVISPLLLKQLALISRVQSDAEA